MKKILFLLTVVIIVSSLLVSCSDKAEETSLPPEHQTIEVSSENTGKVSQDYPISSSSDITLTGLEEGKLYGIYPETGEARSELMARSTNSSLIPTNGGTYLYYADGGDFTFTGSDVGINGTGSVKLIEYEAKTLEQEPTDSDFTIDTANENHLLINSQGERIFEEYYIITKEQLADKVTDPGKVVLTKYDLDGYGSCEKSDDYGIIDPETKKLRHDGIIDLSEYERIIIFNQVRLREGNTKQEIIIQTPQVLYPNQSPINVKSEHDVYTIEASPNAELILNIKGITDISNFEFTTGTIASVYADEGSQGKRYGKIVPVKYDQGTGTAVLYIGKPEEAVLLPFLMKNKADAVTIELKDLAGNETLRPQTIEPVIGGYNDIKINASQYFIPILFDTDTPDLAVMMKTNTNSSMRYVARHTYGKGYSQYGLNDGDIIEKDQIEIPECAWIINSDEKNGTVRIYFSATGTFSSSEGNAMRKDASQFPFFLSDPVSLEGFSSVYLYNMYPGEVYGFRFSEPVIVDDDRLIPFDDNFYGYIATSSTVEFNLEELGVFADSIQVMKFEKSSELKFDSSTDKPVDSDQDQNLYIKCFDVDLKSIGSDKSSLVLVESEKISDKIYIADKETGKILPFYSGGLNDYSSCNDLILFYTVSVSSGNEYEYTSSISLKNPIEVQENIPVSISEASAYELPDSAGKEMVIEFTERYTVECLYPVWAEGNSLNEKCPYFIPLVHNENSSIFYAGCLTDKVLLSLPEIKDASFELREISQGEKDYLKKYELDTINLPLEIRFTKENELLTCIFPAEKNTSASGLTISLDTDGEAYVNITASHKNNADFSTRRLNAERSTETLRENHILQSIVIENFDGGSGKVIISR